MTAMLAQVERRSEPRYRWRIVLGFGFALCLLHTLVLPRFDAGEYTPDIFTLFALYIGLFANRQGRYWPSLVLGLVRDFFSFGLIGTYAVLYSLLHKFAARLRVKLDPDRLPNALFFGFSGVFLVNFGYHFMLALSGDGVGWSVALWRCTATALASAPFAVPLFPLLHRGLRAIGVSRSYGGLMNF